MVSGMTKAILATGGAGQLASAIGLARAGTVRIVGRPEFDFDQPDTIERVLKTYSPALVVNAAAWTAVDAAEGAADAAARANELGPAILARSCRALGIKLVHISTDYVFDGLKGAPYSEEDATSPTGVYGRTKLLGEVAVREAHPGAVILRTSWVYARSGRNFVLTMLNAGKRAPVLRVVADQRGCPTNADDLAQATLAVCDRLLAEPSTQSGGHRLAGIYHAAGQGDTTWHGFATAIFEEAAHHDWPRPRIEPIATADWPTPARRPADSRLDCTKLQQVFGIQLPRWEPSLRGAVAAICQPHAVAGHVGGS